MEVHRKYQMRCSIVVCILYAILPAATFATDRCNDIRRIETPGICFSNLVDGVPFDRPELWRGETSETARTIWGFCSVVNDATMALRDGRIDDANQYVDRAFGEVVRLHNPADVAKAENELKLIQIRSMLAEDRLEEARNELVDWESSKPDYTHLTRAYLLAQTGMSAESIEQFQLARENMPCFWGSDHETVLNNLSAPDSTGSVMLNEDGKIYDPSQMALLPSWLGFKGLRGRALGGAFPTRFGVWRVNFKLGESTLIKNERNIETVEEIQSILCAKETTGNWRLVGHADQSCPRNSSLNSCKSYNHKLGMERAGLLGRLLKNCTGGEVTIDIDSYGHEQPLPGYDMPGMAVLYNRRVELRQVKE